MAFQCADNPRLAGCIRPFRINHGFTEICGPKALDHIMGEQITGQIHLVADPAHLSQVQIRNLFPLPPPKIEFMVYPKNRIVTPVNKTSTKKVW